jgi:hypothetical protein
VGRGDRRTLLEELARRSDAQGYGRSAVAFRKQAEGLSVAAETIRRLIEDGRTPMGA